MGFFSSLFGSHPAWLTNMPAELRFTDSALVSELERLREQLGLDHDQFWRGAMCSRTVTIKSIRNSYAEAKRRMPGYSETEYLGCAIGDRMCKKMTALAYNTALDPLTAEDMSENMSEIMDNLEAHVARCKTLDGVVRYLMDIEEREGSFTDPFHILARIDGICSKFSAA